MFLSLLKIRKIEAETAETLSYRALLGAAAWNRLPVAVRGRFQSHHGLYRGAMTVRASALGRLLAQLCRLIGTPLTYRQGDHIATTVTVLPDPSTGGSRWLRCYCFPGCPALTIGSVKAVDVDGALVERLAAGLRMKLRTYEQDGALHFESAYYFFECFGLRIRLPDWFPPGRTHVIHRDEGSGRFRFVLTITHPWFGELFHQDGLFGGES